MTKNLNTLDSQDVTLKVQLQKDAEAFRKEYLHPDAYAFKDATIPYHEIFSWIEQVVSFAFPAFSDTQVPMSDGKSHLCLLH